MSRPPNKLPPLPPGTEFQMEAPHVQLLRKIEEVRESRHEAEADRKWPAVAALHRLESDLIVLLTPAIPVPVNDVESMSDADLLLMILDALPMLSKASADSVRTAIVKAPQLRLVK